MSHELELPKSTLTKKQYFTKNKTIGDFEYILNVRFDDRCNNNHNTFSITLDVYEKGKEYSFGCQHGKVSAVFPEYDFLIKWHLVSTDGPLHYIANTLYWVRENNLKHARSCACWPEAEFSDLTREKLLLRLPDLMAKFKCDMEKIGFEY